LIGITVFFAATFLIRRMECWNTDYEKRKTAYFTKNVEFTFYDEAYQTTIFCFLPNRYSINTRKSMQ